MALQLRAERLLPWTGGASPLGIWHGGFAVRGVLSAGSRPVARDALGGGAWALLTVLSFPDLPYPLLEHSKVARGWRCACIFCI